MNTLKAEKFIKSNARPLENSLFNYYFGNGTRQQVVYKIMDFQNDDCGFGNAIEPDNWNPNSNPIATNDAIFTLFRVGALDEKSKLTDRIVHYLSSHDSYDKDKKLWLFAVESNKDFPHAIWWEKHGDGIRDYNPSVSLGAFLNCFSENRNDDGMVLNAFSALYEQSENKEMIADDLKCYLLAYELMERHNIHIISSRFNAKNLLCEKLEQVICTDTSKYTTEYVPKPSDFFCGVFGQFITDKIRPLIKAEIELLSEMQLEDGGFDISWQWYTDYKEFEQARNIWRPRITLDKLLFYRYNI